MSYQHKRSAQNTIIHYFKLAARGNGWQWDIENAAELEGMIDSIIGAAQAPLLKRIEELESKFEELEAKENTDFMTKLYKID